MIPSPDWFIGIDSFDLCVNGNWLDSITIEVSTAWFTITILQRNQIKIKHTLFFLFSRSRRNTHTHTKTRKYNVILWQCVPIVRNTAGFCCDIAAAKYKVITLYYTVRCRCTGLQTIAGIKEGINIVSKSRTLIFTTMITIVIYLYKTKNPPGNP